MAYQMKSPLRSIPDVLLAPGTKPQVGAYHGSFPEIDLRPRLGDGLARRIKTVFKLKRWHYGMIATPEVCVSFAVIDAGLAGNAFVFVSELEAGRLVADRSRLGPPGLSMTANDRPGQGAHARFDLPGHHIHVSRPSGSGAYEIEIRSGDMHLEAVLDASQAPDALTVLMPLIGGDLNFTQKLCLMPVTGTLRIGARTWDLGSGFGGMDFTHGLFARRTAWRWGFGMGRAQDGTPIGFNLTDGLSDAPENENVLWVGQKLIPVGSPRFVYDTKRLEAAWQVRTEDGAIDLRFSPRGVHREDRNLVAMESHFAQVAGVFQGTVRDPEGHTYSVDRLVGVTEDQRVVW
jgi:hypothetical protein